MANRSSKKKRPSGNRSGRPGTQKIVAHGAQVQAAVRPAKFGDWVSAVRPATLGLGFAPVLLGWAVAYLQFLVDDLNPWDALPITVVALCFLVALALQIGVNFANDYSDGIRGTDTHRVGPTRLTASGAAPAKQVRLVAFIFFGVAALAGLGVTVLTSLDRSDLEATGIAAAWFYTGGKKPYGYSGLGEIVVFIFFGLVATTGTAFLLVQAVWIDSILAGVAMGLFSMAVLHINNVRDRATDIAAGKRTLATRIPLWLGRAFFTLLVLAPFGILVYVSLILISAGWAFFALFIAAPALLITWTATTAREYVLVLKLTVWTCLAYAALLAYAFAF